MFWVGCCRLEVRVLVLGFVCCFLFYLVFYRGFCGILRFGIVESSYYCSDWGKGK